MRNEADIELDLNLEHAAILMAIITVLLKHGLTDSEEFASIKKEALLECKRVVNQKLAQA